jgi:hypothetical protein
LIELILHNNSLYGFIPSHINECRELNWKKVKLLFDHPIIIVITWEKKTIFFFFFETWKLENNNK